MITTNITSIHGDGLAKDSGSLADLVADVATRSIANQEEMTTAISELIDAFAVLDAVIPVWAIASILSCGGLKLGFDEPEIRRRITVRATQLGHGSLLSSRIVRRGWD